MTDLFRELTEDMQTRTRELACLMWEYAANQQKLALDCLINLESQAFSTLQATAAWLSPTTLTADVESDEAKAHPVSAPVEIPLAATPIVAPPPPPATDLENLGLAETLTIGAAAVESAATQPRARKVPIRAKSKA